MSFGRKGLPPVPALPGELDISAAAPALRSAREFLRMWSVPGGNVTCLIDPTRIGSDPAAFGIGLADCVRHAALAYARAYDMDESAALQRIWMGLDAERASPTSDIGGVN